MTDTVEQIGDLLHEAGETHHRVFRIVDGADDDWASWYAQWLIDLLELPDLLGARPVRSELTPAASCWSSRPWLSREPRYRYAARKQMISSEALNFWITSPLPHCAARSKPPG